MIAKVTRGNSPVGLVRYLFGRGEHNAHTDPHLIASHEGLGILVNRDHPTASQIRALGRELADPADTYGITLPAGLVWHCSISLPTEDGQLSDAQWNAIAHRVMDRLGFSLRPGPNGEPDRAQCRWAAVRHGLSAKGNDHIHLAVTLAREDGTVASDQFSFRKLSAACRDLEEELGLTVVAGRRRDRSRAGHVPEASRADREITARTDGPDEPPLRNRLEHRVRAAAGAAHDEAEFISRLREDGLLVRPRRGRDSTGMTAITGYSIAVDPAAGGRTAPHPHTGEMGPVWFGGGSLATDLTLPKLRAGWEAGQDIAQVQAARRAAAGMWPLASPATTPGQQPAADLGTARTALGALHNVAGRIGSNGPEAVTIADVAAPLSRIVAVIGVYDTTAGRPLRSAERHLARLAQTRRPPRGSTAGLVADVAGTMLAILSMGADEETKAMLTMLREIDKLCEAIVEAIQAGAAPAYELRDASPAAAYTVTALRAAEARQITDRIPPGVLRELAAKPLEPSRGRPPRSSGLHGHPPGFPRRPGPDHGRGR